MRENPYNLYWDWFTIFYTRPRNAVYTSKNVPIYFVCSCVVTISLITAIATCRSRIVTFSRLARRSWRPLMRCDHICEIDQSRRLYSAFNYI